MEKSIQEQMRDTVDRALEIFTYCHELTFYEVSRMLIKPPNYINLLYIHNIDGFRDKYDELEKEVKNNGKKHTSANASHSW